MSSTPKQFVVEKSQDGAWVFMNKGPIPCIATLHQKIDLMATRVGAALRVLDGDTVVAQGTPIVPGSIATH